jgi:cysteine synthase
MDGLSGESALVSAVAGRRSRILLRPESENPTGSMKDRMDITSLKAGPLKQPNDAKIGIAE